MSPRRALCRDVGAALFRDEVGIEYGIYGDYRLKSAYQPIFAPRGGDLAPVAVEALLQPQLLGQPVPRDIFLHGVPAPDRLLVEILCRLLHLGNFRNIGAEGLDLFFSYGPGSGGRHTRMLAEIRLMARHLDERELEAGMLVCEIAETAGLDERGLSRLVGEMRRNGLGVAIGDFGAGASTEERLRLLRPDIVRIDGGWFAELCRHAAATRLFRPLLDLLHQHGAKVLVEGIEAPPQLRLALESGADFVQGALLAPPALAGVLFRHEPLAVDKVLGEGGKVIPLFGRSPG